jgi:hypothetical protein
LILYFSTIEHHVISQLTISEIETQLVREETKNKI